jgi:hypothetical protein
LRRFLFFLLVLAVIPAACQIPRPAVRDAIPDVWHPLAFDQQKLTGVLANRIRSNVEGYLEHVSEEALLASGESFGLFLQSASNTYAYTHDFQLREVMDRVVEDFLSSNPSLPQPAATAEQLQTASDELLGLLDYYAITGDEGAFTESQKIGAALLATQPGQFDQPSPLEALMALYRYQGDERDLNFCRRLADSWHLESGLQRGMIDGEHARAILSNLIGLIKLYRATGEESYLRPVIRIWQEIRAKELSLLGTLFTAGDTSDCITVAWLQVSFELLRLTGQAQYANEQERTIYNQLLAAQNAADGEIAPEVGPEGKKRFSRAPEPCSCAESHGISLLPELVWGRYARGIGIMQYSGGRASFRLRRRGSIQVYSEAAYPETGTILLHVDPAHPDRFPLFLRVPEWTTSFSVDIGNWHLLGKPGQFLTINREWRRGDTVRITIDLDVRQEEAPSAPSRIFAIRRGPQVLAATEELNPGWRVTSEALIPGLDPARLRINPVETHLPANWTGDQAYSISGSQLILVPFADARGAFTIWFKPTSLASTPATLPHVAPPAER